jgi:4-nitrophenyl phosphatase
MPVQLKDLRALVIDADGVLWRGRTALPGVVDFFDFLRKQNISFMIATNNSSRPSTEVVDKMQRIGVKISVNSVLTSSQATALYLPRLAPKAKRIFVVGGEGITTALVGAGYELVEKDADAVVAGIDVTLTYDKLSRASREIRNGALFVGTNGDKTFPSEDGITPGAGSILAALEAASGVAPIIIGKPERTMFDIAVSEMAADPNTTATLGDRLDTDILGGQRAGLASILVMTGVTTPELLDQSQIRPDFVFLNLDVLRGNWQAYY